MFGFDMGTGVLTGLGLNSLALGFKVDFFTWSVTPSARSDSDLPSSLPGVLAGCGVAGDCLSEPVAVVVVVVVPGVAAESLGSSAGTGDGWGWGWGWDGTDAGGWGLASVGVSGWDLPGACGFMSAAVGGVIVAGEPGELPPLGCNLNSLPNLRSSSICDLC